jgi:hypothetical protein
VELIGLFLVAAGLLVVAGVAKAVTPDDTARALAVTVGSGLAGRAVPFRVCRAAVRAGALAEVVLGLAAVLAPRPLTAALVAVSYAVFAAVVAVAWRRGGPLATCGCFGRPDTPPTAVHLLLNVALAVIATIVAATAPASGTLFTQLAHMPWAGVPLLFVSAVALWLSLLAMSALGALEGARRLTRPAQGRTAP